MHWIISKMDMWSRQTFGWLFKAAFYANIDLQFKSSIECENRAVPPVNWNAWLWQTYFFVIFKILQ